MAILVDDARWEWRGLRWAHLVSDRSRDELHEFARSIGKRRLGFQGDHYDVDSIDRDRALAGGAVAVDSRELVRRLRDAGLRDRNAKPRWQRLATWAPGVAMTDGPVDLRRRSEILAVDTTSAAVALFADPHQRVLLCDFPDSVVVPAGAASMATGPRADGSWSIELYSGSTGAPGR
ncbi:MAG: DUF4031 domain-containing protein [Acidimicrobiales bacterium]